MEAKSLIEYVKETAEDRCCCADNDKCEAHQMLDAVVEKINDGLPVDQYRYCSCGNRLACDYEQRTGYCRECV